MQPFDNDVTNLFFAWEPQSNESTSESPLLSIYEKSNTDIFSGGVAGGVELKAFAPPPPPPPGQMFECSLHIMIVCSVI